MNEQNQPSLRRPGRPRMSRPHPVDVHVGGRIRQRRLLLGMSQEKLAEAVGLTFQQIQKYERGANRVGSSRLFELSRILDVPVQYFFELARMEGDPPVDGVAEGTPQGLDETALRDRETLELVRAFRGIKDPAVRRRVYELAKSLSRSYAALPPELLDTLYGSMDLSEEASMGEEDGVDEAGDEDDDDAE